MEDHSDEEGCFQSLKCLSLFHYAFRLTLKPSSGEQHNEQASEAVAKASKKAKLAKLRLKLDTEELRR
jgi:transcriptional antiterminator Rof (Rho-off)